MPVRQTTQDVRIRSLQRAMNLVVAMANQCAERANRQLENPSRRSGNRLTFLHVDLACYTTYVVSRVIGVIYERIEFLLSKSLTKRRFKIVPSTLFEVTFLPPSPELRSRLPARRGSGGLWRFSGVCDLTSALPGPAVAGFSPFAPEGVTPACCGVGCPAGCCF